MGVFYTASWRARESIIEFIVTGNVSDEWLGIGFTDKQMMVSLCVSIVAIIDCHIHVYRNLIS